ncbi:MAG TPA: hypothetical protein VIA18_06465 [Polyangia bacterium]|nr:hypothetical protein [Polyangia bacterium]
MKPRSPVLGYNHNVRYAGRLWHVQTEDSGVGNPHIFTHLFHDGTILATKRIDYDPTSDVAIVQKLMQAQHKAMLRDLKQGAFDDKIARFFGTPVVKSAADSRPLSGEFDAEPKTDPSMMQPPPDVGHAATQAAPKTDPSRQPIIPPRPPLAPPMRQPSAVGLRTPSRPNLTPSRPAVPVAASRAGTTGTIPPPPRPPVSGIGGRRPAPPTGAHAYGGGKPTAEGVVVARPAVIVGEQGAAPRPAVTAPRQRSFTPSPMAQPPPQPSKTPSHSGSSSDNIFGGDLISEKSLDEVILAYLSEDLNDK